MEVTNIKENKDGSATVTIELYKAEMQGLVVFALERVIMDAVEEGLEHGKSKRSY